MELKKGNIIVHNANDFKNYVDYVAELEQQCKKQKEVIDRIQKIINTEIKLMGYAVNDSCLILIQDVLKEVSE